MARRLATIANRPRKHQGRAKALRLCVTEALRSPPGGLQELVERHNKRLDLPPEVWSKEVIAEAVQRAGTAV